MSDIAIDVPLPVALAILVMLNWPVLATVAGAMAVVGIFVPVRWVKVICFALAAGLACGCLLAAWVVRA